MLFLFRFCAPEVSPSVVLSEVKDLALCVILSPPEGTCATRCSFFSVLRSRSRPPPAAGGQRRISFCVILSAAKESRAMRASSQHRDRLCKGLVSKGRVAERFHARNPRPASSHHADNRVVREN